MHDSTICPHRRFKITKIGILVIFVFVILRLFQIQVLNVSRYRAQAREQQWQGFPLEAKRGTIFTSDLYPVASNETRYDVFLDMNAKPDMSQVKKIRSSFPTALSDNDINDAVQSQKKWIKIVPQISADEKKELLKTTVRGLSFEESYTRYYPESSMLSHVLGFVGENNEGNPAGYYGLEQYYDGDLRGQNGWLFQEKSAGGVPILWGESERIPPLNGSDLVLTVDRNVQFVVEKLLQNGVDIYNAKSGTVIVADPKTGKIIAFADYPNFNPGLYREVKDPNIFRNHGISSVYEPGSVMKAMTMSTGIDISKITPETTYMDNGPKIFSGYKVDNWDGKHHGEETMIEILQHSNNLGAAWVGQQVGGTQLLYYFRNFGFGSRTGVDLEGEEAGVLYPSAPLKDIELANASFGQGVAVTPLQLVMAFSAIANRGFLMQPYVVSEIHSDQKIIIHHPHIVERPISESTATTLTEMLRQAVEGGEAKFFVSKKYHISGKTGTAQVAEKGGYSKEKTNATFIGFFTNYKNFVLLVKLEEPTYPSGYAAETAVPLWMKIAEQLALLYGLTPDK